MVKDSQKLRIILGSGMSNKMWDVLMEHARTCVLSGKLYIYYIDDTRNVGVVFNNIYELSGLITDDQYHPADALSDSQKVYVDSWVKKAYDNWSQVVEYDGKSLLNFKQTRKSTRFQGNLALAPINYPHSLDHQLPSQGLSVSVPYETSSINQSMLIEGSGYNNNTTARYSSEGQLINSSSCAPLEPASFTQHDQQVSHGNQIQNATYDNSVGLALGLPHSSSFRAGDGSLLQAGLNPFDGWSGIQEKGVDDFMSEEELRMRSLQMLENEDMQHLLRLFGMGGHASVNVHDLIAASLLTFLQSLLVSVMVRVQHVPGRLLQVG